MFIIHNLKIGQYLITTTNEKAIIVEIANDTIKVNYRGKIVTRPKSIVGEKLFLTEEDQKIINDKIIKSNKSVEDRSYVRENDYVVEYTCKDCMAFRRDDCFGEKKFVAILNMLRKQMTILLTIGQNICKDLIN